MELKEEVMVLKQCVVDQQELLKVFGEQIKHLHIEIRKIKEVLPPVTDFDITEEEGMG